MLQDAEFTETRWYISGKDKDADFVKNIRSHWQVVNSLHRVPDMAFGEDFHRKPWAGPMKTLLL